MEAHLGDQLVIESTATGAARRDGEIVGLHDEDGTPPSDVRWSDTDEVTLVFPGPDAHVRHLRGHHLTDERDSRTESTSPATPAGGSSGPGDVGRRVADERRRQGISRVEAARRARMSPDYLACLEENPADPGLGTLVRLADALGTTVTSLLGGGTDRPPGQGRALWHPRFRELSPEECRVLLSTHGVGRVAVSGSDGRPVVVPVNYEVVDEAIVYRTAPHTVAARTAETEVAFEVDHVDQAFGQGWSVLAVGRASVVTDPGAVRRLSQHAHTTPWAGGEREMWVSIRPASLTGRRIDPDAQRP
ncbi:pyridoxamine 5'-phosphate oxidase family protein [Streptomyces sp. NPDC001228]|uniref:pyridoxamine 5'-phosphate oxidase family protein n=1 Tax=Streptomyces sp. NPDC001228 TaxID=3154381 RepID=UPI00331B68AC